MPVQHIYMLMMATLFFQLKCQGWTLGLAAANLNDSVSGYW